MCKEAYHFGQKKTVPTINQIYVSWQATESSPQKHKNCNKCFPEVDRAISHKCLSAKLISNTRELLGKRDLVTQFVADEFVKRIAVSDNDTVDLAL